MKYINKSYTNDIALSLIFGLEKTIGDTFPGNAI
jgi:hypothetical protein